MGVTRQSTQDLLDLYRLGRNVDWRYRLDQYEDRALNSILATLDAARVEIGREFETRLARLTSWGADRNEAILGELEALTLGVRQRLAGDIADAAAVAGQYSAAEHSDILSVGGRAVGINDVALSAGQFRELFGGTPVGGRLLEDWVSRAFETTVQGEIRQTLNVGMLRGEGYRKLVARLGKSFNDGTKLAEREAITLARTYVQSANVAAMEAVYRANADVVTGERWSSVLEPGYRNTGRGTCMRCAALDGREWKLGEARPPCPLHPRCRCVILAVTISWRKMGLNANEIEAVARPYTIRPDENIDAGGRRAILEVGAHGGNYGSWWATRSHEFQLNVIGPERLRLIEAGRVKFGDLVDPVTGELRTLAELGAPGRAGPPRVATLMAGDNAVIEAGLTAKHVAALQAYTGEAFRDMNRALRSGEALPVESQSMAVGLSSALRRLPRWEGTVWRGLPVQSIERLEEFDNGLHGGSLRFPAFTSTSTAKSVAEWYGGHGPRVVFEIKCKKGAYLGRHSAAASTPKSVTEREVLFERGSMFRVLNTERIGDVLKVLLEES